MTGAETKRNDSTKRARLSLSLSRLARVIIVRARGRIGINRNELRVIK